METYGRFLSRKLVIIWLQLKLTREKNKRTKIRNINVEMRHPAEDQWE